MSGKKCNECQHFRQHYTFDTRRIFRVHCGHCTLGRPRKKQPDSNVCKSFVPNPAQEDAFVTKEYLSKELLQYMLSLELLPEIEDRG